MLTHTSKIKQILILNKDNPNFLNYDFFHSFIKKKKNYPNLPGSVFKKKKATPPPKKPKTNKNQALAP